MYLLTLSVSGCIQGSACLCAGARDLAVQKRLLDEWNRQRNNLDTPSRAIWYRMGEEMKGQTLEASDAGNKEPAANTLECLKRLLLIPYSRGMSAGGAKYVWACVAEVRLDLYKALTRDVVLRDASKGCVLCWQRTSCMRGGGV